MFDRVLKNCARCKLAFVRHNWIFAGYGWIFAGFLPCPMRIFTPAMNSSENRRFSDDFKGNKIK